jgi:hypothetical protein
MKKLRRPSLHVERLEARDCPAMSAFYNAGSLTLRGIPNGILNVTGKAGNVFQVTDNGNSLGNYAITGNLSVLLANRHNELNFDLKGLTFSGNVSLGLGTGYVGTQANNSVDIFSSVAGGRINGNVYLSQGNGTESWDIGAFETDGAAPNPTSAPITIAGNVTATGRPSGGAQTGNSLSVFGGSNVLGNVNTSQISDISLGTSAINGATGLTTIAGNVVVSDSGSAVREALAVNGNIAGNVTMIGTNLSDSFTLLPQGLGVGGNVAGSVTVVGGNGGVGKNFFLGAGTTIAGSATFMAGNNGGVAGTSGDTVTLDGNVNGSVSLNLGNGVENVEFQQTATGGNIGGNLNVTSGNGTNLFGSPSNAPFGAPASILNPLWTGTVNGSVNLNLGNGSNRIAIAGDTVPPGGLASAGFSVGGSLNIRMGNGTNIVAVSDITPGVTNVIPMNITYGKGANTFFIAAGTTQGNLTGTVNFNSGTDSYLDNKYVWTNAINLLNL